MCRSACYVLNRATDTDKGDVVKNVRKRTSRTENHFQESNRRREAEMTKITHRDDSEHDFFKKRVFLSSFFLVFFFAVLVSRLWYLQIQQGELFARMAENNRVRYVEVTAPRGNIFDKKGREIVTNRPSFNVVWSREDNKLDDTVLKQLARILDEDVSVLLGRIRKMENTPRHIPIRLADDLNWDKVAYIENNRLELPGIKIEVIPLRVYHYDNLASHLLGYLGEINEKELNNEDESVYRGGDQIGKMGLERIREKDLRGEKGRNFMEVNALGFEQKNLKGVEPLPGNDIHLTLDIDLQKAAEDIMNSEDKAGAVVAVEVNSGRLLALVSSPPLRINEFVGGISINIWQEMLDDPHNPLINKLVQGLYPPASTYKIVTAAAGLAEGIISPEMVLYCSGQHRFGNRSYGCWKKNGHGAVTFEKALAESCDIYFYIIGQRLGVDRLAEYANKLGLGQKTGVEMEHEKSGLIPTSTWKKRRYKESWQEGETLSVAIGQGFDLATPLQVAMMTAAVANGGTLFKPVVIEKVIDPDNKVLEQFNPTITQRFSGQSKNLKLIRQALVQAVNGPHGTGKLARINGITVAGKTGTAQVVRLKQYKHLKEEDIPYKYRDHAWFTCFAPAENPEIAVTVLVEHGLHGGSSAAPVAKAVLEAYFKDHQLLTEDVVVQ